MSLLSERLKTYREELKKNNKKWTQQYVAEKIGVARVTYTAYERGTKTPPLDIINQIADLFDIDTDYLHGRTNDPSKGVDEELKELLNDPQTDLMFNNWRTMTDEERREVLDTIEYLHFKRKRGKK
ncbi:helix-turn-helix domain-containing protein [Lentibacillus jeotgali]|uniref:helix-turn-helix domain-containing protein n=1 Tax=Lentibacillus jeotgali TaxID=558169 RepID=UPI00026283C2|nr:helix-turn-helix transcriptional regulator [Lentibacillus jeotgali]